MLDGASLSQLEGYLGEGQLDITNIFTKQAGSTATDFHAAADGQGRTFSVLHVSGTEQFQDGSTTQFSKVIGGYNPQSWNSTNSYNFVSDPAQRTAFLFNLTDSTFFKENTALDPTNGDTGTKQTYNSGLYGPTFGGGHDLHANFLLNNGYSYAYSYTNNASVPGFSLLLSLGSNQTLSRYFFQGFNIDDLEVFTIANSPKVSSVPLPASLPLMSSALALFGFGAAKRKNKSLA